MKPTETMRMEITEIRALEQNITGKADFVLAVQDRRDDGFIHPGAELMFPWPGGILATGQSVKITIEIETP